MLQLKRLVFLLVFGLFTATASATLSEAAPAAIGDNPDAVEVAHKDIAPSAP